MKFFPYIVGHPFRSIQNYATEPFLPNGPKKLSSSSNPFLVALGIFALFQGIAHFVPWVPIEFFCRPSSELAGWFLGETRPLKVEQAYILAHPLLQIQIGRSCSGFGFFTLLGSLGCWSILKTGSCRSRLFRLLGILPAAYLLALASNVSRIISSFYIRVHSPFWVSPSLANAIHFSIGTVIFLTVLLSVLSLLERKSYEPI